MKKAALILSVILSAFLSVSCGNNSNTSDSSSVLETVTEAESSSVSSENSNDTSDSSSVSEAVTEAVSSNENELDLSALNVFELTSDDLNNGVWDSDITNTSNGSNRSPQLSWEPVEGASDYVIYMIDTSAGNWVHWKSVSKGETELPAGWASSNEYIGPYPPDGTHDYQIYVFALKEPAVKVRCALNSASHNYFELIKSLDNDGGNVIAYGTITGTYTYGD